MTRKDLDSITTVGTVLSSRTCLLIIICLSKGDLSNQEIYDKIKDKIEILYRSSIFLALKRITDAGLIEKYYDYTTKKLRYTLKLKSINIDFSTLKLL